MNWEIPEDIRREIDFLDMDKKEKIFRYIHRESEVGRYPTREELLEIIQYLKGKTIKDARKSNFGQGESGETVTLNYERPPKDYLKLFNCHYCIHVKAGFCNNEDSVLYKKNVRDSTLCSLYNERT